MQTSPLPLTRWENPDQRTENRALCPLVILRKPPQVTAPAQVPAAVPAHHSKLGVTVLATGFFRGSKINHMEK